MGKRSMPAGSTMQQCNPARGLSSACSPEVLEDIAQPKLAQEEMLQAEHKEQAGTIHLRRAHDSMARVVQPARPRLCRRCQASFGRCVCGHLNGVPPSRAKADPAVVLRHLSESTKSFLEDVEDYANHHLTPVLSECEASAIVSKLTVLSALQSETAAC